MRAAGLARGGSLDNAVVISGDRVLNQEGLRYATSSCATRCSTRWATSISPAGRSLGHFRGVRSGHALNRQLLRGAVRRSVGLVPRPSPRRRLGRPAKSAAARPRLSLDLAIFRYALPPRCGAGRRTCYNGRAVRVACGGRLRLRVCGRFCASRRCCCAWRSRPAAAKKDTYVERPVEELYNTAMDQLGDENYQAAAKDFDEVDRQHPYSVWATKAQLMSAYALYQAGKYDESIIAADRFIQLHPGHRDVAYAYYLKALDYYMQIADVGRDQRITQAGARRARRSGAALSRSRYARDARTQDRSGARPSRRQGNGDRPLVRDARANISPPINRFKPVVDQYQTTTHVPEALHRLTECYLALGLNDEAQHTAAVLGYNYPGSEWYQRQPTRW